MKDIIIICLCIIVLAGCVSNSSNSNSINSDVIDTVSVNKKLIVQSVHIKNREKK